jgi:hypothetical protein
MAEKSSPKADEMRRVREARWAAAHEKPMAAKKKPSDTPTAKTKKKA